MHCTTSKQAQNYFILNSFGESKNQEPSLAIQHALAKSGVLNSILSMHQFIPEGCEEIECGTYNGGETVEIMLGKAHGKKNEQVASGICIAKLKRKKSTKYEGSLVCSYGAVCTEDALKEELSKLIEDLYETQYSELYEIDQKRFIINSATIKNAHGVCITGIGFTNFQQVSFVCDKSKTRFLEYRCDYSNAKYCFVPVSAGTIYESKSALSAAASVLKASTTLESYEVETDQQAYKAGFHTFEMLSGQLQPEEMVNEVQKRVGIILADGKIPITISGSSVAPIGAYKAIRTDSDMKPTLLSLDARLNLRDSFQGSSFHPYTLSYHGKEMFTKSVSIGARICANREKNLFDPDTTWFSMDMIGDTMWVEDVLEELSEEVYLSINVNIFDPSCINANDNVPDGMFIRELLPLFKKLARKRKIVGIDIHGICPELSNTRTETTAASLIYKLISYIEAYKE